MGTWREDVERLRDDCAYAIDNGDSVLHWRSKESYMRVVARLDDLLAAHREPVWETPLVPSESLPPLSQDRLNDLMRPGPMDLSVAERIALCVEVAQGRQAWKPMSTAPMDVSADPNVRCVWLWWPAAYQGVVEGWWGNN